MTTPFHDAFRVLSRIDAPIVTAAHGAVAGGGLGYVYAADLVIAAEDTRFVTAFAALGLSGDGGGTWHLPRLIGPRARGPGVPAQHARSTRRKALDWGLINEIVPAGRIARARRALATRTGATARPAGSPRCAPCSASRGTNDLSTNCCAETEGVEAPGTPPTPQSAIAAFADKQQPDFTGR